MNYRKKPVVIQAVQWTGDNLDEIKFLDQPKQQRALSTAEWVGGETKLRIATLEGIMTASVGDFVIKGMKGELYPCREEIFWETYERV